MGYRPGPPTVHPRPIGIRHPFHVSPRPFETMSIEERARRENDADELWILQVNDTADLIRRIDHELRTG